MKTESFLLLLLLSAVDCTFFGGGGGGCSCAEVVCPPDPVCLPPPPPIHVATIDCCPVGCVPSAFAFDCISCRRNRRRRYGRNRRTRWKRRARSRPRHHTHARDEESKTFALDPKCNSERLRGIIKKAVGAKTSTLKRNIQLMAEKTLHGQYSVLCGRGAMSYITTTDEYCQEDVLGRTCYVFSRNLDGEMMEME